VKARAPGKVVISGAYAVLEGAPAIVSAVDRYAVADSSRQAEQPTPEVRAALGAGAAPWFDASALFEQGNKLGLGASAAILVASLAALEGDAIEDQALASAILPRAFVAHRQAQLGGSGIDVLASARGGTRLCRLDGQELVDEEVRLPDVQIQIWSSGQPASTAALLERVRSLGKARLEAQARASQLAADAVKRQDASGFVRALQAQRRALAELGAAAGVPIVSAAVEELAALAGPEGASVIPSGAGGGDVALFVGRQPPSRALLARAAELGYRPLAAAIGARGAHRVRLSSAH
jgi:phosphomevalonate kinase